MNNFLYAQTTYNTRMENAGLVIEGKNGTAVDLVQAMPTTVRVQDFAAGLDNLPTNSSELTATQLKLLNNSTTTATKSAELSTAQLRIKDLASSDQSTVNKDGLVTVAENGNTAFYADRFGISLNALINNQLKHIGIGFDPTNGKLTLNGNVCITGTLSHNASLTTRIDHPQNPTQQFLDHSTVVAPQPINMYTGRIITNEKGYATVELPNYFEFINTDYNYHLTVIGKFAQAIIAEEIYNNQFIIQTSEPNVKVSWQITGQRDDAYHQEHLFQTVSPKTGWDKGKLLYEPQRQQPYSKEGQMHWQKTLTTLPTLSPIKETTTNSSLNSLQKTTQFSLNAYPNPATKKVTIDLNLAINDNLTLQLFNLNGQFIQQVAKGKFDAGLHQFNIPVSTLPKGIYELVLSGEKLQVTKKVIVL